MCIVAPSGPFDRTLLLRGAAFLAERYRIAVDWSMFSRQGYLAGSDERRLTELDRALADPDVRAVVAARGGYGLTRIVPRVDFAALRRHPKWVVGFSDVTALHVALARRGIASMHAHNACGLGRGDAHGRALWIDALERPHARRRFGQLQTWQAGIATGPLFGGNLMLLFACCAAGQLRVPDGAVLVIEDVTESSYRLDRMLTALESAGAFDRVAAVVVGELTDCSAGPHGVAPADVLRERLSRLGVPVVAGLGFGHGRHNQPLPLGLPARVEPGALTLGG